MLQLQDTQLALIHIPLELYPSFLQPILQLLLPSSPSSSHNGASSGGSVISTGSLSDHPFINISVTPIECSIACSRHLANALFLPARQALPPTVRDAVSISSDDYVVMQVDGEGLEAGQRVLELTAPLAMAGISIFFITTYFSDYILVPNRSRVHVISALEARGFVFEPNSSACTTAGSYTHRASGSASSFESVSAPPGTPPPTSVSELQTRTFATLKKRNVGLKVDPSIRLIQCAGQRDSNNYGRRDHSASHDRLHLGLVRCFASTPKFLSLTLTESEPPSLLLEKRLLGFFDSGANVGEESVLLGAKSDVLVPIILDLRTLPLESTGIVCGIAGRLVGGTRMDFGGQGWESGAVEMSYLSTARAGTVMVAEREIERALRALREGSGLGSNGYEADG
ncbi:hypothetical protein EJ06DRAFT_527896 [Trichodelitschia bisporula]|uniref:CASTOR ACT domain-containing protein n=1 Tax=Trichodelitschia bisporula TaxID=703511 RepID=A0A6G1I465_9PEZI|nr:hypothetical protein EJ06DRAFT_527896 [Trichodelitschia bisporula]